MTEENMISTGQKKICWKNFTFPASLLRFMLFKHCGKYSKIALLHLFERSGIVQICVADSIIAVWTRSVSVTKIVSERHVSAKCEHDLR